MVIVEFALVMPVFLMLILGVYDVAELLIVERRLAVAASEAAQIGTNLAIQPDNTNVLSLGYTVSGNTVVVNGTLFPTITTPFAYFPTWLTDSTRTYSITLSSIAMKPTQDGCTSSCSYAGHVAWSIALSHNETGDYAQAVMQNVNWDYSQLRPCDQTLTATAPDPGGALVTPNWAALRRLPVGVLTSAALLVADVSTTYTPMFLRFITGPVPLFRSGFMPPRVGELSQFVPVSQSSTNSGVVTCTGYATTPQNSS